MDSSFVISAFLDKWTLLSVLLTVVVKRVLLWIMCHMQVLNTS